MAGENPFNPFVVGDWALHVNNQLDSRKVVEIRDRMIRLEIGDLPDVWVPAANYTVVPRID